VKNLFNLQLRNNGLNDWFLPSRDELNQLYRYRAIVEISSSGWFWSSSQTDINFAWGQSFVDGSRGSASKDSDFWNDGTKIDGRSVRAVRAF